LKFNACRRWLSYALWHSVTMTAEASDSRPTNPFQEFFRTEAAGGALLVACACAALVAGAAKEALDLALERDLQDQPCSQPDDRLDRIVVSLDAAEGVIELTPEALARDYARHRSVPPRSDSQVRAEATPSSTFPRLVGRDHSSPPGRSSVLNRGSASGCVRADLGGAEGSSEDGAAPGTHSPWSDPRVRVAGGRRLLIWGDFRLAAYRCDPSLSGSSGFRSSALSRSRISWSRARVSSWLAAHRSSAFAWCAS